MTEHAPSRIDRIREVHPWLHPGWVRAALCIETKKAFQDPAIRGDTNALQIRLECYVDVVRRMTEHDMRNELSKVQEHFVDFDPSDISNEEELTSYSDYLNEK